jgi:hypothetical protein
MVPNGTASWRRSAGAGCPRLLGALTSTLQVRPVLYRGIAWGMLLPKFELNEDVERAVPRAIHWQSTHAAARWPPHWGGPAVMMKQSGCASRSCLQHVEPSRVSLTSEVQWRAAPTTMRAAQCTACLPPQPHSLERRHQRRHLLRECLPAGSTHVGGGDATSGMEFAAHGQ